MMMIVMRNEEEINICLNIKKEFCCFTFLFWGKWGFAILEIVWYLIPTAV